MSNLYRKRAATWREAIGQEMEARGEGLWPLSARVEAKPGFLDSGFGAGHWPPRPAFTVWTDQYVYFATIYDGYVGVGSVPRHPNGERSLNEDGHTQFKPDAYSDD